MKNATLGMTLLMVLAAAPAAAQKVYVDYDAYADFSSYKSFAWVDTNTTSLKVDYPEVDSMIKNNLEYYMVKGGLIEDTKDPDLYITYHASTANQTQFMTSTFGYGYGAGWNWGSYWGPRMVSGTMTTDFEKGTMIIDIWDARKKEALFRGTITNVYINDPMKVVKKIDDGIDKVVDKYRKMRAKDTK